VKIRIILICLAAVVFNSCLGVFADITIKADGSGKIALEYRVSQALESVGRLDGNEHLPAVPVGRTDFERSIARIPGLKLTDYSIRDIQSATGGRDLLTRIKLDYRDSNALLAFLDNTGSGATLIENREGRLFRLTILEPSGGVSNPDLLSLLKEVSSGYELGLSFNLPEDAAITTIPESIPAAKLVSKGKKASFTIGMGELLSMNEGLVLEIRW
jgi:hypothetical protein